MQEIKYKPIGVIRSPFTDIEGMPIQPNAAIGIAGTVDFDPELAPGLKDLEGFSHVILIYHFHLSKKYSLEVKPFLDDSPRGVFATRSPARPNSIGLSIVRLTGVSGATLAIEDVDILDGTPLLDIKPFVPAFDSRDASKIGWLQNRVSRSSETKSDRRFAVLPHEEGA
jgi:tRNA (adenine37-N6)-methyltransferase